MARENFCPKHGAYDSRLGKCPQCPSSGAGEEEATRIITEPGSQVSDIGSRLKNASRTAEGKPGSDATILSGRGQFATEGEPAAQQPQWLRPSEPPKQQPAWGQTQTPPPAAQQPWGQPQWPPQQQQQPPAQAQRPFSQPPARTEEAGEEEATVVQRPLNVKQVPLAWLAVVEGPGGKPHAVFSLSAEVIVGRANGDIILRGDPMISAQHAKIRFENRSEEEGGGTAFVIYDLASANGTYVGDKNNYREEEKRIYRKELKDNDYLLFGETTLVFKQVPD